MTGGRILLLEKYLKMRSVSLTYGGNSNLNLNHLLKFI